MAPNNRELAEKLCLSLPDCLGGSHDTVETLMRLYPEQFEIFVSEVRTLITAELAAKAVPDDIKELILSANDWRDGGLVLPNNANRIIEKITPYLATLTTQAGALRKENERLREALKEGEIKFEVIRRLLVKEPKKPIQAAFCHAVTGRDFIRAALETGDEKEEK